jgi:hypothetical protein
MAADSRTRKMIAQRSLWVIHDCEKFHGLIREVKDLIDGVQDITKGLASIARQDHMIKSHVMRITDEETLDMVSDVCDIDHPSIADAATARADTISMATTKRLDITDWTTAVQVDTEQSDEIADLDVESLTITELKHILRSGLKRNITTAEDVASMPNSAQGVKPTLETSDSAPQSRSELDLQYFEEMQQEMATAKSDQDFMAELDAIQSWFDVLSSSERFTTLFVVNRSVDSKQQRLLAQILTQISAERAANSDYSKENAMPSPVASDTSRLNIGSPSRSVVDSSAGLRTSKEKKDHGNFDLSAIFTMFPDRALAAIAQDEEFVNVVKKTRSWGR